MPARILVRGPSADEEVRALAEVVSDLHYGVGVVVENATYLLPGEAVDELREAWSEGEKDFIQLVRALDRKAQVVPPISPPVENVPPIPHEVLAAHELTGPVGKAKRSLAQRLKDRFFSFWNAEPRSSEKIAGAREAAASWFEFGEAVVGSIPGWEKLVELLSLVRQLFSQRAKGERR